MKNFYDKGEKIDYVVTGAAIASGDVRLFGDTIGVAGISGAIGETVPMSLCGTYTIQKTTGEAWNQGQKLYWNDTTKKATTTVGTNKVLGVAAVAALAADTEGLVRLNGVSV